MELVVLKRIKNFILCLKYPFYKARSIYTDRFLGYSITWLDHMPNGWRKAFGKQFSIDLKECLKRNKELRKFRFMDIKEKWGSLCLYCNGASRETIELLGRYEQLSANYCIECGDKATHMAKRGWIRPLCDKCDTRGLGDDK